MRRTLFGLTIAIATTTAVADHRGDFNGDGFDDLAIGVSNQRVSGKAAAGAVHVVYGSPTGPSNTIQYWHQNKPGVPTAARPHEYFGSALTPGDFDGDGFDDLAIGSSGERVGGKADAGAVFVLRGSAGGLHGGDVRMFHQNTPGVADGAGVDDFFGDVLVSGDFDGDGFDDLAVGVPSEDRHGERTGVVHVFFGHASGLRANGDEFWHQGVAGVGGVVEEWNEFGWALAAGDLDDDGFDDLAIGIPGFGVGDDIDEDHIGAVAVLWGTGGGLAASAGDYYHAGGSLPFDVDRTGSLGISLATGDFDGDGFDDLSIGAPGDSVGNEIGAGAVHVLPGSASGLVVTGERWHQDRAGVPGFADEVELFGWTIETGDFDGDGYDDLAVQAPWEGVGGEHAAGAVNVIYGAANGLHSSGSQYWHRARPGVAGQPREFEHFGDSMVAGDLDGDGDDELAIGTPASRVVGKPAAGVVHIMEGHIGGLSGVMRYLHENRPGFATAAAAHDRFGRLR